MFYKFNFIFFITRNCFLVIYVAFLFLLLLYTISPNEAFAMEPPIIEDYYGQKVYTGTYADFNSDPSPDINTIQSRISPSYGTQPLHEDDWYANKKEADYMHSNKIIPNKNSSIYFTIKRISFYYLWKIHSSEYIGYKDFKKSWDPSKSIRKEILKDIKSEFKFKNK